MNNMNTGGTLSAMGMLAVLSFALGAAFATNSKSSARHREEPQECQETRDEVDNETPRPVVDVAILEAARVAACWMTAGAKRWHQGKVFMDACVVDCPNEQFLKKRGITPEKWRKDNTEKLQRQLESDPELATFRPINEATFPLDGWTCLHYAAFKGNMETIQVLLNIPGVSAWSLDFQGRTPLALATEGGHANATILLKEHMEQEAGNTIVGPNAPVDLAGRTPLGCCHRRRLPDEVKSILFARGDASICPSTPPSSRSGGARMDVGLDGHVGVGVLWGHSSAPGWSRHMQDESCSHSPIDCEEPGTSMFGVFDGHGSSNFTSAFAARELKDCLLALPVWKGSNRHPDKVGEALEMAFIRCDELLANKPNMVVTEKIRDGDSHFEAKDTSGSTGVVAVVTPTHVTVANAGDSRAILIKTCTRRGSRVGAGERDVEVEVIPMSTDHTGDDARESERVTAAGGTAYTAVQRCQDGTELRAVRTSFTSPRNEHSVSPTRGFGDFFYKQKKDADGNLRPPALQVVTVCPEITSHERGSCDTGGNDEEFLLMASDGLWDVFQNQDAGEFFISHLPVGWPLLQVTGDHIARVCDALVHECLRRGSHDNLTALAVSVGRMTHGVSKSNGVAKKLFN